MTAILRIVAVLAALAGPALACEPEVLDIRDAGTTVRFSIEIADTPDERATGLMHRESMPQFSGMLFIYERPQPVSFWMKNTLIPLDMLFIDETGTVQNIARETTPLSLDSVFGGSEILQVLEINGGLSAQLGIDVGAQIRHPSLDQGIAAWPCAPS